MKSLPYEAAAPAWSLESRGRALEEALSVFLAPRLFRLRLGGGLHIVFGPQIPGSINCGQTREFTAIWKIIDLMIVWLFGPCGKSSARAPTLETLARTFERVKPNLGPTSQKNGNTTISKRKPSK